MFKSILEYWTEHCTTDFLILIFFCEVHSKVKNPSIQLLTLTNLMGSTTDRKTLSVVKRQNGKCWAKLPHSMTYRTNRWQISIYRQGERAGLQQVEPSTTAQSPFDAPAEANNSSGFCYGAVICNLSGDIHHSEATVEQAAQWWPEGTPSHETRLKQQAGGTKAHVWRWVFTSCLSLSLLLFFHKWVETLHDVLPESIKSYMSSRNQKRRLC